MSLPASPPLTAEQILDRPDPGYPEELVEGRIMAYPPHTLRHGWLCTEVLCLLGHFIEAHDLGHLMSNGSGVITRRDPDTVRGPDLSFYSYSRLPRGPLSHDYGPEIPELIVEVLEPHDSWAHTITKIAEYLTAGSLAVLVLGASSSAVYLFRSDAPPRTLGPDDLLTFPDILPGFEARVSALLR